MEPLSTISAVRPNVTQGMATTLGVDFYSGGSFIYALQAWNKKGAPAIPCEINSPHQSGCKRKLSYLPLCVCFRPKLSVAHWALFRLNKNGSGPSVRLLQRNLSARGNKQTKISKQISDAYITPECPTMQCPWFQVPSIHPASMQTSLANDSLNWIASSMKKNCSRSSTQ